MGYGVRAVMSAFWDEEGEYSKEIEGRSASLGYFYFQILLNMIFLGSDTEGVLYWDVSDQVWGIV